MSKPEGGSAFPSLDVYEAFDIERGEYKVKSDVETGMSLRDYFAAKALAGLCADYRANTCMAEGALHHIASHAYALADFMLKEREK